MPVSATTLRMLLDAGIEGDDLVAVVASIDADAASARPAADDQAERRRAADRLRKQQKRAVCGNSAETSADTAEAFDKEAPHTPQEITTPPPPTGVAPKSKRGTRLAPDWAPTFDPVAFAAPLGLTAAEVAHELAQFRDHFLAATGAVASKLDWDATLRKWLRRAGNDKRNRALRYGGNVGIGPPAANTGPRIFVDRDTPQWDAWLEHYQKTGKPTKWLKNMSQMQVPTEWPPQEAAA